MEDSTRDWGQEEKEKGIEWRKRWVVPLEGCVWGKKVTETVKMALLRRWYRKIWRQTKEEESIFESDQESCFFAVIFLQLMCIWSKLLISFKRCNTSASHSPLSSTLLCVSKGGGERVTRGKLVRWNKATVMLRPQAPPSWAKLSTVEFFSCIVDLEAVWPELKIHS